jgi:hypothetical protein
MKTSAAFSLGALSILVLVTLMLVLSVFLWQVNFVPPLPAPSPNGAPQSQQSDLQTQVDELTQRVDKLENDQAFNLRDIAWKMDQKLFILVGLAFVLSGIATFFGYRTYKDLDQTIKDKVNATLDKELYQLDPTLLTIHVRETRGLESVWRRLELTGLENLSWYGGFDDGHIKALLKGVTVVPIENDNDEKEFRRFLKTYRGKLSPIKAAFILYSPRHKVSQETLDAYDNLVTANMPATVASMVLVVGRGLKPPK